MEKRNVFGSPLVLEEKDKGGNIMEKRDIYGGPIIQDPKEREEKVRWSLPDMFQELFVMGWRDNDARIHKKETFFEMLKGYAEGIPEEEIWEAWGYFLEYTAEELRENHSEEMVAAIMAGDDEAASEIEARESYRKWVEKRKNSPFPLKDGEKITIKILYPTGNYFEGGEPEIGSEEEYKVGSADEFYNIINKMPVLTKYIVVDEHGKDLGDILP